MYDADAVVGKVEPEGQGLDPTPLVVHEAFCDELVVGAKRLFTATSREELLFVVAADRLASQCTHEGEHAMRIGPACHEVAH